MTISAHFGVSSAMKAEKSCTEPMLGVEVLFSAEASLLGQPATGASFAAAARQELASARPRPLNAFKVELAQRAITRALTTLTDGEAR